MIYFRPVEIAAALGTYPKAAARRAIRESWQRRLNRGRVQFAPPRAVKKGKNLKRSRRDLEARQIRELFKVSAVFGLRWLQLHHPEISTWSASRRVALQFSELRPLSAETLLVWDRKFQREGLAGLIDRRAEKSGRRKVVA